MANLINMLVEKVTEFFNLKDALIQVLSGHQFDWKEELLVLVNYNFWGLVAIAVVILITAIVMLSPTRLNTFRKLILVATLVVITINVVNCTGTIYQYRLQTEQKAEADQYFGKMLDEIENRNVYIDFDFLSQNFSRWEKEGYVSADLKNAEAYSLIRNTAGEVYLQYTSNGQKFKCKLPSWELMKIVKNVNSTTMGQNTSAYEMMDKYKKLNPIITLISYDWLWTAVIAVALVLILLSIFPSKGGMLRRVLLVILVVFYIGILFTTSISATRKEYTELVLEEQTLTLCQRLENGEIAHISKARLIADMEFFFNQGLIKHRTVSDMTRIDVLCDEEGNLHLVYQLKDFGAKRFETKLNNRQILDLIAEVY